MAFKTDWYNIRYVLINKLIIMKNQKRKKRSGLGLFIGVILGAIAGYWLNTTSGKLWRKKSMDQTADLRKDFTNKADEYSSMARDKAKEFSGSVGQFVDDLVSKKSTDNGNLGNA